MDWRVVADPGDAAAGLRGRRNLETGGAKDSPWLRPGPEAPLRVDVRPRREVDDLTKHRDHRRCQPQSQVAIVPWHWGHSSMGHPQWWTPFPRTLHSRHSREAGWGRFTAEKYGAPDRAILRLACQSSYEDRRRPRRSRAGKQDKSSWVAALAHRYSGVPTDTVILSLDRAVRACGDRHQSVEPRCIR